ncbi:FAD-dependent 5-carboxymethylaminomethyl-2-thiouridine(34) oxidoreductase MnmC [Massilia forsythiae]|uniref:FAD-dependent 5-carboxymethylaminomethyl-2-thiouridine(34) oxidoreductase MnmC n=1 Tax=Massilia forsythiae TaxID=2728020 RepID=A0A7Z2VUR8_9BURK|nr:FAD-dependent 5-carboxymethylaminomethyl-2-thiouridine(34) oxidoreductase MnmC [Massilia forsythiae]QJD99563.1 FAD-dependent 5-carboxymethylaminomethyl-2-thiouridine(34) oxidoreductase MnmC [Massilia forsythiae]
MDYRAAWRGRARHTVFTNRHDEARLGAMIDAWRADPERPPHLHVIALIDAALPGFRRVPQAEPGLTLDLLGAAPGAPFGVTLAQLAARIDLFRLDGGDAVIDAMIDDDTARAMARLAARDACLVLEGADAMSAPALGAAAAAALAAHGFVFEEGGKRARFAGRKPRPPLPPDPQRQAIVLGAGIAGSAACERLCARGWQVTLVERHAGPALEASGNRAGIFMPLLSRDDNIPTRLTRAAYLFTLRHWERLGGIGHAIEGQACGVLQLARDAGHAAVQRALAAGGVGGRPYPPDFAEWLERPQAEALLGSSAPDGGWLFRRGGWARPGSVCDALLAACGERLERRFGVGSVTVEHDDGQWHVLDAHGIPIAHAPNLILANGAGAAGMAETAPLPLSAMRGQVSHIPAQMLPRLPLVLCREAYLTPAAHGICSAGATYDLDPDPVLSLASHRENLARLRGLLADPHAAEGAPLQGRVGFRCIAPDRLPLVGRVPDAAAAGGTERLRDVPRHPGLYALLGYASRGLIWAGLGAELLAAQIEGEPLPLETALVDALDPARFVLRARRSPRGPQAADI